VCSGAARRPYIKNQTQIQAAHWRDDCATNILHILGHVKLAATKHHVTIALAVRVTNVPRLTKSQSSNKCINEPSYVNAYAHRETEVVRPTAQIIGGGRRLN
jgi:hypothetical protein